MIAGILLAAGEGRRFGESKLLYPIGGKPLLYYSLRNALDSSLSVIHAVIDGRTDAVERTVLDLFGPHPKLRIVRNVRPQRGMMSSLKDGLRSLEPCDGAAVILADMPLVSSELIDSLTAVFERDHSMVVPQCGGRLRHPRIIPKELFPDFLKLKDREKGTKVISRIGERLVTVTFDDASRFLDVDRPEDLEAYGSLIR